LTTEVQTAVQSICTILTTEVQDDYSKYLQFTKYGKQQFNMTIAIKNYACFPMSQLLDQRKSE